MNNFLFNHSNCENYITITNVYKAILSNISFFNNFLNHQLILSNNCIYFKNTIRKFVNNIIISLFYGNFNPIAIIIDNSYQMNNSFVNTIKFLINEGLF